jgi:hypothetical protein
MSVNKQIKDEIKIKFPEVNRAVNNWGSKLKEILIRRSFPETLTMYLALITCVILYTAYIDLDFLKILNINFDDSIKTITTCTITLVSMNLFVTNLLLTHLKEEREDLESIIDRKINFKFITYLGFTIIICILFLYFISPTITHENIKCNLLIFIFCSFLCYILALVFLYNSVFKFINKLERSEIINSERKLELYRAFHLYFFRKRFREIYDELMENELKFKQYESWTSVKGVKTYSLKIKNKVLLKDIKINKLKSFSESIPNDEKYYHPVKYGRPYKKDIELALFSLPEMKGYDYKKVYSFTKNVKTQSTDNRQHLDRLLGKISNNTANNKYRDLELNLNDLSKIFKAYIEIEHGL